MNFQTFPDHTKNCVEIGTVGWGGGRKGDAQAFHWVMLFLFYKTW